MIDTLKGFWYAITGKILPRDIVEADAMTREWLSIYNGRQDWLNYSYVSLDSKKHERKRRTMNAAKLICSELARLVWSENPEIATDESIEDFLEENNFYNKMSQFTEYMAAGGGFAMKLFSPDAKKLRIDYVPPDCFIPISWDNSRITEADFIDKRIKDGKSYLRVEKHRIIDGGYRITTEVYEEDGVNLIKKPISEIGLTDGTVEIQTPVPLFVYIGTPEANNHSMFSPLGVSIYANAVDTLYSLDVAFDSLQQEIVLGKKRIIVPSAAVRAVIDTESGKPVRYFDPSDEVFQAINTEDVNNLKIVDNTVELRIDELKLAIQTLIGILTMQTGFSAGAFSFDGTMVKTATEVISESSKSFRTKQSYENQLGKGILGILEAIRAIGPLYGIKTTANEYTISWNDSVIEDRNSLTDYWIKRYQAGTCTLADFLEKVDGLPDEEAKAKAAEVKEQTATIDVNSLFNGKTA